MRVDGHMVASVTVIPHRAKSVGSSALGAVAYRIITGVFTTQFWRTRDTLSVKAPGKDYYPTMRPIITVDVNGHLFSTIEDASVGANAIIVGSRFEFEKPYETPWGEVPTGVVAIVTEVHEATGELDLEVPEKVPALFMWSNVLIMLPFMSEDLGACLRLLC
jgi:hypothetical protein